MCSEEAMSQLEELSGWACRDRPSRESRVCLWEKQLTTIMVTHNLRFAVEYGNRLLMMHHGNAILDREGEEKAQVRVEDLLSIFNDISIECGN